MKTEIKIKQLLDKYFEGNTSCEEERTLRRYFSGKNIPSELAMYKPMFNYVDEEIASRHIHTMKPLRKSNIRYIWMSAAAIALIVLGIAGYNGFIRPDDNYVIINGVKSSNLTLARQQASQAFKDVSFTQEDIQENIIPNDMEDEE
jgi:hypothetical protein